MQLVHCAYTFRGQVSVLQYTVSGATMLLFSLQCVRLFFIALVCFRSRSSLTNWQQITGINIQVTGFSHAEKSKDDNEWLKRNF